MYHLITDEGEILSTGRMVLAHTGRHAGTYWRFDAHVIREGAHVVRASRLRHGRRDHIAVHPSVFRLEVREVITRVRSTINGLHHTWQKFDEWLIAGVVALVPLAFFEHFHWAESITSWFTLGGH